MSDNHPKISKAVPTPAMESGSVKNKPRNKGNISFDKILSDQTRIDTSNKNLQPVSSGPLPGLPEIEGGFNLHRLAPLSADPSQLTVKIADSLDLFEKYAAFLGDPDKNLKQAYSVLEQVLDQVETLAAEVEEHPGSKTESASDMGTGIKDMLNQLLTSARVEQIKFNRGDYL